MQPDQQKQSQLPNPKQTTGQQGAVFVDAEPPRQAPTNSPPQAVNRGTFMSDLNPGAVIPGDPNSPIQNPGGSKANINPNSTQNSLQIAEIRDGIVIMNDGSFRSVVMVKSINFDLMSPQEREAVEFSYQGFLNSLYFPIQIFIRSQKVDLRPYLEKLDKIRSEHDNMLLALLMEDYIAYMDQLSSQTNIMDKRFYVVIGYPDIDEADIKSTVKQSTSFFTG